VNADGYSWIKRSLARRCSWRSPSTVSGEGHCHAGEDRARAALPAGSGRRYAEPGSGNNRLVPMQHVHGAHRVMGRRTDGLPRLDSPTSVPARLNESEGRGNDVERSQRPAQHDAGS